jgi:hypothetical protein
VLLLDQVEQPAGRSDDHVHAAVKRFDLRLVRAAAVHGEDAGAELAGGEDQILGHLDGQLTSGDQDQPARLLAVLARFADELEHRDTEGVGLSGAGAGLADDVLAGQRQRERHLLNREWCGYALGLEGVSDFRDDSQVSEGRGQRSLPMSVAKAGLPGPAAAA